MLVVLTGANCAIARHASTCTHVADSQSTCATALQHIYSMCVVSHIVQQKLSSMAWTRKHGTRAKMTAFTMW